MQPSMIMNLEEEARMEGVSPQILIVVEECIPFSCGDHDMDDFFQHDALKYTTYKMGKSRFENSIDVFRSTF